jgi:hypothetical protein
MKNSPENNFWNEVRNRLDNYAEEPADDSWDKIAGAISTRPQPRIIAWLERRASSAQVSLAGFAAVVALVAGDQSALWNDRIVEVKVKQVETSASTVPAGAEPIAAADVAPSPSTIAPQYHTTVATTPAKTTVTTTPGGHVQHVTGRTLGTVKNANGKTAQQQRVADADRLSGSADTAEAGDDVYQQVDADRQSADADQVSSVDVSPVGQSDDIQAQANADGQTTRENKPGAASTVIAIVVDTTGQKDANKKKKEQAVAAKEKKEAEKKKAQLHIPMVYFQVGPSLAYHKITPSTNDNVTITDLEEPGVFASDRVGLSVEAGFQYRVAPRIEVYGGLSYYHQNQHIRYTVADASAGSVTGNAGDGYTFTPVITKHDVNYTMRNAGVSAGMFYRIKTHLLEHKFGVGLLYQQGFKRTSGEGATYTNDGSKYLQYQLQYRMEAGLNDHMRLYFQPGYTHAFHVDEKLNEPFTIKPYRAGISVGIVYLLGK